MPYCGTMSAWMSTILWWQYCKYLDNALVFIWCYIRALCSEHSCYWLVIHGQILISRHSCAWENRWCNTAKDTSTRADTLAVRLLIIKCPCVSCLNRKNDAWYCINKWNGAKLEDRNKGYKYQCDLHNPPSEHNFSSTLYNLKLFKDTCSKSVSCTIYLQLLLAESTSALIPAV